MEKRLTIITMALEDYMDNCGEEYEEGNLFDYSIEELEHIMYHTNISKVALIDGRLYEL